jgi:flagellar protein FliO/FliZ
MSDSVVYIMTFVLLVALGALAVWIAQQSIGSGAGLKIFQTRPRRTGVVEATSVDGRRRLVLIRRDNVEHLIMTGGPVDVVIETGIPVRQPPLVNGLGEVLSRAEAGLDNGRATYHGGDGVLSVGHDQPN